MNGKLNITFYNVLFIVATVTAVYYNGVDFKPAKYVAMTLYALLFVIALSKASKIGIDPLFKSWFIWLIVWTAINALLGVELEHIFPMEQAMPLMIAFSSTYLFTLDDKQFRLWFLPLSIVFSFIAYMSVIEGIGSLTINENSGGVDVAKNQIGPCFTIIAIICFTYTIQQGTPLLQRIIFSVATVINIYPPLFLGCRTALVCFFLIAIVTTFRTYRAKGVFILFFISTILLLFWGRDFLNDILYTSLVGERDTNNFSSLVSDRDVNMIESWNYFLKHPLFGLASGYRTNIPGHAHIYILHHLTRSGLLGSIPALVLYFSVLKIFIQTYKKRKILIFAILGVAFIESFAEYCPPFGPGSCFSLMYLIIGMFLRNEITQNQINQ